MEKNICHKYIKTGNMMVWGILQKHVNFSVDFEKNLQHLRMNI